MPDDPHSPDRQHDEAATIRAALDAVGQLPDEEIALAETALLLARLDAPWADWRRAQSHLSVLAREAAELRSWVGPDALAQAEALAGMLGCRHDYNGDYETYDDLRNVNLIHVTERRRGMPIGLGIVWLHCAEVAGWDCYGINFPSHFILGIEGEQGLTVLDVFSGGRILEEEDLEAMLDRLDEAGRPAGGRGGGRASAHAALEERMGKREVLIRLQRNIAYRREGAGDLPGALVCAEDMLRFAPQDIGLWQQAAVLQQKLGQISSAVRSMEHVVELMPPGADADRARGVIRRLRSSLN